MRMRARHKRAETSADLRFAATCRVAHYIAAEAPAASEMQRAKAAVFHTSDLLVFQFSSLPIFQFSDLPLLRGGLGPEFRCGSDVPFERVLPRSQKRAAGRRQRG